MYYVIDVRNTVTGSQVAIKNLHKDSTSKDRDSVVEEFKRELSCRTDCTIFVTLWNEGIPTVLAKVKIE